MKANRIKVLLALAVIWLFASSASALPSYVVGSVQPDNGGGGFGQSPTWQDVRRCVIRVEGQNGIEAEGRINALWQVNMTVSSPDPAVIYHLTWECPSNVGLSLIPLDFQLFPLFTQTFSGVAVFTN